MIAKEAFQVTAAFLTLPSETPVLPEVFKRATLDNLKALSCFEIFFQGRGGRVDAVESYVAVE